MTLPIEHVLEQLKSVLRQGPSAVLQAPPGAGKTTRVPLALLSEPWLQQRRILMLEPRRLAARSAARYMAAQLGEAVGQQVGYRTRLDSKISAQTRIEVVTEGILTRMLQDDPALEAYGLVIFDEFHERSLQADLGLALCLESQTALRDDLRLLVMSATLDAEPVAQLLGAAPLITSAGRAYPVALRYLPPPAQQPWEQHLLQAVLLALREETGSILVFLPGSGEIRRLQQALENQLPADCFLAPLYGDLTQQQQDAAITPAPPGQRKLVLATAIAETSLTIDGVRVVIDSGLQRLPVFDPVTGLTRLQTQRLSQAAAEQRKGRAGRVQEGVCYRLWSQGEQASLPAFTAPEILQADLCDLVLELAQWGALDPHQLAWLDPPPLPACEQARQLLQQLGALDEQGRITDHGKALSRHGQHPRLAHMLEQAQALGWATLGAELAALLSERDVLVGARHADVQDRIHALRGEPARGSVDRNRVQRVRSSARQLLQRMRREQSRQAAESRDSAGVLLAYAYPERVARRRPGKDSRYLLANGRGARLHNEDPLGDAALIVAAELDNEGREARVFLAAELSVAALEEHFGAAIEDVEAVLWDDASGVAQGRLQRRYRNLVLSDKPLAKVDSQQLLAALLQALIKHDLADLPWDEDSRQWLQRVEFLRRLEGECWPDVSLPALTARAESWVAPYAQGYTRLAQFRDFPLLQALQSLLDFDQQRQLERKAPARLEVPTGSQIRLDYGSGETPILAVRLQELFGLAATPRIAEGKVAVLLHLLSPGYKPVQVTSDLASFWQNTYADVRKDLRGRYPKHHWPDDPLAAAPTRHAKRRGT